MYYHYSLPTPFAEEEGSGHAIYNDQVVALANCCCDQSDMHLYMDSIWYYGVANRVW